MKNLIIMLLLSAVNITYAETNPQAAPEQPVKATQKKLVPKAASVSLETAYKREFAFLTAQKKELNKRLSNYKAKTIQDEKKLESQIRKLEQTTVENSALLDRMDAQLSDAERVNSAMGERSEVLDMTYNQAESTLQNYNIDVEKHEQFQQKDEQKLAWVYRQTLDLLATLGQQRLDTGKFFLHDGKEVQGKIIRLGNIAAYGVSDQGSGVLAPAGGENYKLWKESSSEIATALGDSKQPDLLKVFLYESLSKVVDEKADKTWLSVIESGGVIGWIIVILGVVGIVFVFARGYLLFINSQDTKAKAKEVMALVQKGDLKGAENFCNNESCAITRVMSSTLKHIKDDRDHMEDIIVEAILNESGAINRFGSTILVVASVAPLLGLLGTVTGMISTFDIITEFGTGDPKMLSSGISVALVTTQLGLIVAIPTLLFGSLLTAWANNIKRDMEKSALMITNSLLGKGNAEVVKIINQNKDTGFQPPEYQIA